MCVLRVHERASDPMASQNPLFQPHTQLSNAWAQERRPGAVPAMHGWPVVLSGLRRRSWLPTVVHLPLHSCSCPPRTQQFGFTWPWVASKDSLSDLSVIFSSLSGTQLMGTISSAEWNAPYPPRMISLQAHPTEPGMSESCVDPKMRKWAGPRDTHTAFTFQECSEWHGHNAENTLG